ncbi:MAG: hypothetical protein HFI49_00815 [Bacilli bacterium]|jgi:hypothetical protein|nr:hypothetical protein [Bacilli bacterium]
MNKSDFCQLLIDDIKDEIEFDSDVVALKSLLLVLLNYNVKLSFENWKYLILNYDINSMKQDINFLPLIRDYPKMLIKKIGVENFFDFMQEIPFLKTNIIYVTIFNVFSSDCLIYQSLEYYMKNNDNDSELKFIKSILNKSSYFSTLFFNKTEMIKRIIILHIENKSVQLDFLKSLIDKIDSKKEQAVLKALLIDYFTF